MTFRYLAAAALAVVGAIFIGQGLGYIGGSTMTNDPFWAAVGGVLIVVAIALAAVTLRASRS